MDAVYLRLRIRSCAARGTPSLTPSCTTMAAGKSCTIWGRVGRAADGSIPFAIAVILRRASGSIGRSPLSEGGPLPQARIPVQQTPVRLTDRALSEVVLGQPTSATAPRRERGTRAHPCMYSWTML